MKEQMREAFEAWAEKELLPLDKRDSEHYRYNLTNRAWAGWKAALSAVPANHSEDALKMVQAVNALAAQTGEPPESITEWLTDKGGLTTLMLSHFGGKAQQPAQEPTEKDVAESITLLSAVIDAWENGTDCYDDYDGVSGSFIGKAFNLDDEIFKRCCSLLNRINPPRNVSQQPAQEPVFDPNLFDLATLILSDCGISENNQRLYDRVLERLIKATDKPQEPVKQESWISVDDVQSLVDASEIVMKWLVKNVHQWNFSEYDWLSAATERIKASLPPVKEVTE